MTTPESRTVEEKLAAIFEEGGPLRYDGPYYAKRAASRFLAAAKEHGLVIGDDVVRKRLAEAILDNPYFDEDVGPDAMCRWCQFMPTEGMGHADDCIFLLAGSLLE